MDVIVLHFFWVVCSLPIVTFGPATTALYFSIMKTVDDKEAHYYRAFFKSFKQNLKQGIPLGLMFLGIEAALLYTFVLCSRAMDLNALFPFIRIVALVFAVLVLMVFTYVFALQARFNNTIRQTLQNAAVLMVQKLGWSMVMTAILIGWYVLFYFFFFYIFPLVILGFGLVVFAQSFILNRIFQPYIEELEGESE